MVEKTTALIVLTHWSAVGTAGIIAPIQERSGYFFCIAEIGDRSRRIAIYNLGPFSKTLINERQIGAAVLNRKNEMLIFVCQRLQDEVRGSPIPVGVVNGWVGIQVDDVRVIAVGQI